VEEVIHSCITLMLQNSFMQINIMSDNHIFILKTIHEHDGCWNDYKLGIR